jgi:hypothetical protein
VAASTDGSAAMLPTDGAPTVTSLPARATVFAANAGAGTAGRP